MYYGTIRGASLKCKAYYFNDYSLTVTTDIDANETNIGLSVSVWKVWEKIEG